MEIVLALLLGLQDDPDAAIAQFKTAYKNPDEKARAAAVAELGKVKETKVLKLLAGLLTADTAAVRREAALALGTWTEKPNEVGPILFAAIKPNLREGPALAAVFDALGNVRFKPALDEVTNRMNHTDDAASAAGVRTVGKLGNGRSMDRLLGMWNTIHDYYNPRPNLSGGGGPRRTPELDRRYGMQEPELKTAVKTITAKEFPNVIEARNWWNANRATFRDP